MEYLIADTHYFHKNILEFESNTRGEFSNIDDMNEYLITQWNEVISANDVVYHLGDFSLHGSFPKMSSIIKRLNGNIVIIQGNHDDTKVLNKLVSEGLIKEYHPVGVRLKVNKQVIWLTHYPMEIGLRKNKWSIHGHIHSNTSKCSNQINVGVDSLFMNEVVKVPFGQPISLHDLIEYLVENPVKYSNPID